MSQSAEVMLLKWLSWKRRLIYVLYISLVLKQGYWLPLAFWGKERSSANVLQAVLRVLAQPCMLNVWVSISEGKINFALIQLSW